MMDSPVAVFVLSVAGLWISAQAGIYLRRSRRNPEMIAAGDLVILLTATLTLLGLIIGFTFSMAVAEYDQRRNSEEAEANAIGTEYLRAGLFPAGNANTIRELLRRYTRQRILFYTTGTTPQLQGIDAATARLQTDLWSAVQSGGTTKPDPTVVLVVSGMNDVLNSQGYTQAAWRNRIPVPAWALAAAIALCGNLLFGYTAQCNRMKAKRFFVLPLMVSVVFFLIADMDNPRPGIIQVNPQNLINLSRSM